MWEAVGGLSGAGRGGGSYTTFSGRGRRARPARGAAAARAPATPPHTRRRPSGHPCPSAASGLSPLPCRSRQTQIAGDARAEVGVDLGPVVVDRALLDEALDPLAQIRDDVADQPVTRGVVQHLAVERAGLDEVVVVLVRLVGRARHLGGLPKPAWIGGALRGGPRGAVAVRCGDRPGPHLAGTALGGAFVREG